MQYAAYSFRALQIVVSYPWIGPGCLTPSRAITSCAYRFYGSTVYRRRPSGILVAPTVVRSPEGDTVHKRKLGNGNLEVSALAALPDGWHAVVAGVGSQGIAPPEGRVVQRVPSVSESKTLTKGNSYERCNRRHRTRSDRSSDCAPGWRR